MHFDADIDTTGLLCPLPVLKAAKRLRAMAAGEVLRMVADDPAAEIDVPHYCNESGNRLLKAEDAGEARAYFIQKTG